MSKLMVDAGDLEGTLQLGRRLGAALAVGHVVGLVGPLGSGKTTLVKGIAEGAGVNDLRQVNSPTFVIVNQYETNPGTTPLRIYHIDTYRLRGGADLEALGFDEMCTQGAAVIEWAERVQDLLPRDRLTITIEPLDGRRRRFYCETAGPSSRVLLAALPAGG